MQDHVSSSIALLQRAVNLLVLLLHQGPWGKGLYQFMFLFPGLDNFQCLKYAKYVEVMSHLKIIYS